MTDMTNFSAALQCEYAAHLLRKNHTVLTVGEIYGFATSAVADSYVGAAIEHLVKAADLLGFELVKKDKPATELHSNTENLSTAGEALITSSALQDIDEHAPHYCSGLSGRLA
jgi:hypothetical protein